MIKIFQLILLTGFKLPGKLTQSFSPHSQKNSVEFVFYRLLLYNVQLMRERYNENSLTAAVVVRQDLASTGGTQRSTRNILKYFTSIEDKPVKWTLVSPFSSDQYPHI